MRLIRPLYVARLLALLIAFGIFVPAYAAEAVTRKKTTRTSSRTVARKPAYSASASQARKARLARARAAA